MMVEACSSGFRFQVLHLAYAMQRLRGCTLCLGHIIARLLICSLLQRFVDVATQMPKCNMLHTFGYHQVLLYGREQSVSLDASAALSLLQDRITASLHTCKTA